jgi:O-acetyl-ADP-ribose deacetylase (regulator of RNase III)
MYFLLFFSHMLSAGTEEHLIAFDTSLKNLTSKINSQTIIALSDTTELIIEVGDITKKTVDVIVNAANKELQGGAGVCGAIFASAGNEKLQNACDKFPVNEEGIRCPVGQACITDSFDLSKNAVKKIIHAVGPDCRIVKAGNQRSELLRGAYLNSLILADKEGFMSIAFPFISSGIYDCPRHIAAQSPHRTIMNYVNQNPETSLRKIYIVLFSQADKDEFDKQIKTFKLIDEQ